jgi:hypothetical protein
MVECEISNHSLLKYRHSYKSIKIPVTCLREMLHSEVSCHHMKDVLLYVTVRHVADFNTVGHRAEAEVRTMLSHGGIGEWFGFHLTGYPFPLRQRNLYIYST